jgi:hypothetical protein
MGNEKILLRIPHAWDPRDYQLPLFRYMQNGGRRAVCVWNRRSGKDSTAINFTATDLISSPGVYWHMAPTAAQVRLIVWDGIDKQGRRVIDQAFPDDIRRRINNSEMKIEFKNGSVWQCVGSDNYDKLVGPNPRGVVFSEYSIANPKAWDYIRPILVENGGWAIFLFTPRGKNHAYKLYEMARESPDWFAELLTVEDTKVVSLDDIARERSELEKSRGAAEAKAIIDQEYYCSFTAAVMGAYYGEQMERLQIEGRIADLVVEPNMPVITAWDIGVGDSTAIWFAQVKASGELDVIDYYEASGVGIPHYAKIVKEKPYIYDMHLLPHDISQTDFSTGISRLQALRDTGIGRIEVLERTDVDSGINAVRALLPRCRFDRTKCARGIEALTLYQKSWSENNHDWSLKPLHDWSSHAADSFRYLAQGYMKAHPPARGGRSAPRPTVPDWSVY